MQIMAQRTGGNSHLQDCKSYSAESQARFGSYVSVTRRCVRSTGVILQEPAWDCRPRAAPRYILLVCPRRSLPTTTEWTYPSAPSRDLPKDHRSEIYLPSTVTRWIPRCIRQRPISVNTYHGKICARLLPCINGYQVEALFTRPRHIFVRWPSSCWQDKLLVPLNEHNMI